MLLNKHARFIFIVLCFFLIGASQNVPIHITGIKSELSSKIRTRLTEYLNNKNDVDTQNILKITEQMLYEAGFFKPQIHIIKLNPLEIRIQHGPYMRIVSLQVRITGEGKTNPAILKAAQDLPLKRGAILKNVDYEKAKDDLITAAEHQGYLHASFNKATVVIDKEKNSAQIVLHLNTGTQYFFGQVRFDPTYISPSLLERYIHFKWGQPYTTEQVLKLNTYLSESGYFKDVNIKPILNQGNTVPLEVHLQKVKRIQYTLGAGYGTDTGLRGEQAYL